MGNYNPCPLPVTWVDLGYLQVKKDLTSELAVRDKEDTQPGQTFFPFRLQQSLCLPEVPLSHLLS